jgi:hypothetical protein
VVREVAISKVEMSDDLKMKYPKPKFDISKTEVK